MGFDDSIHSVGLRDIKMVLRDKLKYLAARMAPSSKNFLHVLLYHDIAPNEQEAFKQQMIFAAQHYHFLTMDEFEMIISGKQPLKGKNLLLTFDDGYKSNREVAEHILEPLGIKACFFVLPDFIDSDDKKKFIAENLYDGKLSPQDIPDYKTSMSWQDLECLISKGHTIGSHTKSHVDLAKVIDEKILAEEIIESGDIIQRRLGVPINHFAYPYGNVNCISAQAMQVIKKRYQYVFSGVRGANSPNNSLLAIRRDEVSPNYSLRYFNLILAGGLAPYHYFNCKKLDRKIAACELGSQNYQIQWDMVSRDEWEKLFSSIDKSNILQSWGYGQAKTDAGRWQVQRGVIYKNDKPIALLQGLVKSFFGWKIIRINRGPLWILMPSETEMFAVWQLIKKQWSLFKRCLLIISPELYKGTVEKSWLAKFNFRSLPLAKWRSMWINLQHPSEKLSQLLLNSKGRWRKKIKLAEQAGLQYQLSSTKEDFQWLMKQYEEYQNDKNFKGPAVELLNSWYSHSYRPEDCLVFRATHENETIAALLIAIHGTTATYLVGWNSEAGRQHYAHHFLFWNAFLILQQRNCRWFDMGGIDDKNTPGVAQFKQGLNGEEYCLVGEYLKF